MERLTWRRTKDGAVCPRVCAGTDYSYIAGEFTQKVYDRLAYYEDLEEQGRLVVLPCKVGDKVYITTYDRKIEERTVSEIRVLEYAIFIQCYGFGYPINYLSKTVFLTREEAEKALKEDA